MEWPHLVGDVGGTNARFALVHEPGGSARDVLILPSAEFRDLGSAIQAYLDQVGASPRAACVAVAGPVLGDRITLTNVSWTFSVEETRRSLGLPRLLVVNDFLALAMAVPGLSAVDTLRLGPVHADARRKGDGPIAVVGPGTGLGVAGIVPSSPSKEGRVSWTALATEGGHVGLAPETERETEILRVLRRSAPGHVSAEMILSGPGLETLHRLLAVIDDRAPDGALAADIVQRGLGPDDPVSRESLEIFAGMLGAFAGNVALTLGARGGVYLGGGVAQRLGDWLAGSAFRRRFEDKGVMSDYLRPVPTFLITAEQPTFLGAAQLLLG